MTTFRAYRIELYYYDLEAESVAEAQDRLDNGDVDWTESEIAYGHEGLASEAMTHDMLQVAIDRIFDNRLYVDDPVERRSIAVGMCSAVAPPCGHSVCSQNFIDTGERECVDPAGENWQALWTPEYQARSVAEGWAIFNVDDDPEIQRLDMIEDEDDADATPLEPVFGSDACAVAWVLTHAKEGSPMHALALSIHRRTYPDA